MVCCLEQTVQSRRLAVHHCSAQTSSRIPRLLSLRSVVWSCLFSLLPFLYAWCFQFCTTSTFTFGQFPEVGLLAIFDRRLSIRRQTLQASVPVLETVRTNAHSNIRLPSPYSHPLGAQFAHFPVFRGLEVLVCLLHHCVIASALLMWYASCGHLLLWHCSCFLSPRDQG